jgi:hypothetical protein
MGASGGRYGWYGVFGMGEWESALMSWKKVGGGWVWLVLDLSTVRVCVVAYIATTSSDAWFSISQRCLPRLDICDPNITKPDPTCKPMYSHFTNLTSYRP